MKRQEARPQRKFPVTKQCVREIAAVVDQSDWNEFMLLVAIAVGVELLLRTCEFCRGEGSAAKLLRVGAVTLEKERFELTLRDTKCDPEVKVAGYRNN